MSEDTAMHRAVSGLCLDCGDPLSERLLERYPKMAYCQVCGMDRVSSFHEQISSKPIPADFAEVIDEFFNELLGDGEPTPRDQ